MIAVEARKVTTLRRRCNEISFALRYVYSLRERCFQATVSRRSARIDNKKRYAAPDNYKLPLFIPRAEDPDDSDEIAQANKPLAIRPEISGLF